MASMTNISIAVLALVGLPLSPAVAVDELILSGPYVFALTRDIEGCLKPLALEPQIAQCRTIPKGTRVNPKEPTRTNFILTCIEDGREPRCLYIPAEILGAAQPEELTGHFLTRNSIRPVQRRNHQRLAQLG